MHKLIAYKDPHIHLPDLTSGSTPLTATVIAQFIL